MVTGVIGGSIDVGSLVSQAEAAGLRLDEVPDAMIGMALGASGDAGAAELIDREELRRRMRARMSRA